MGRLFSPLSRVLALLLSLPLLSIVVGIFSDQRATWQHLIETVLGSYLFNSLGLALGVGLGVTFLGTIAAGLVTLCQFPGRKFWQWALLLPMAAPAYILAYTYTEFLEYYGPVQSLLRRLFGWQNAQEYWFPAIRSLTGAIVLMTLVLYPYVYLLARSAFINQANATLEASRSLGCQPLESFIKVALPMARPAIVSGLSLALMETLNDYGTVEYFSVPTFTTGIFRTWFALGERRAAIQLAALLLGLIGVLLAFEKQSRQRARFYQNTSPKGSTATYPLDPLQSTLAILFCAVPVLFGFMIPTGLLVVLLGKGATGDGDFGGSDLGGPGLGQFVTHSLVLAAVTAAGILGIGVILAYAERLRSTRFSRLTTEIATLGYAMPGAVIAVGTMVPLGQLDNAIDGMMRSRFGISTGLLLSGTTAALVFAYVVRFLAVGFGAIASSLGNIKPSLDDASRSLGRNQATTLWQVHLPLMRSGLITAVILVFVDVMKELPVTLIMRPQNFDTLAVRVYNLASDERLAAAAMPALAIVMVGLLPVGLLSWQMNRSGDR
jgi:iron(III) transport system permease protein